MKLSWFNLKRMKNIFLINMILLGILLAMSGSKMFMMFLGMEMKMFGIIPFILLNSEGESSKVNVSIYYFLVQVFGSMTFLWGNLMGSYILGIIGLSIKMGISPFFWWVPSIFKRLDWFSMMLMGTMQKMPSFMILRGIFDFSSGMGIFVGLSGLMMSILGMKYSNNNMKVLMAWSSVGNMSLIFYLMVMHMQAAFMYFFCYCMTFILMSNLFLKKSVENIKKWSKVPMKSDLLLNIGLGILIFSGLPPLLGFQWKVFFFSGLKTAEVFLMVEQMGELEMKDYMVEFPLCQDMAGWKMGLIISFLLVLQMAAYMKIFMKIYMSFSSSLEGSSRLNSKMLKMDTYLMMLTLMSLMFLVS